MIWIYYALLLLVALAGLFASLLGLPGLWLMIAAVGGYAWLGGFGVYVGWPTLGTLIGLAVVAEATEFLAGAAGSKAAGGRKRGMIGAVIGALIGGIIGTPILLILGTIIGACIGAFIGAAVMELTGRDLDHAMRVGAGAARGRLLGILIKLAIGLVMLIVIAFAAFPVR